MAGEDIQITVGVSGNRDIKTLNDNVSKVEASVKKLAAGLDSGRISSSAFEKAITQQSDKLKKLKFSQDEANKAVDTWAIISLDAIAAEKASSKAKQEAIAALKAEKLARKEASDAAKLDKIAKQEAALAAKQEALTVKLLADAERDLQDARQKIIASTQQEAAVVDQLKSKYQAGYRELKLYKAENEQLNLAYQKNILTADQLRAEQDKLSASFAKGTGMFSTYAQQMKNGANRMGVAMQQTGYQVGDFLVQIQSGANPMMAFGQQATQLIGVMYLLPQATLAAKVGFLGLQLSLGAIVAIISVVIPLVTAVAAAWMRSSDAVDTAKKEVSSYSSVMKSAGQAIQDVTDRIKMLNLGLKEKAQLEIFDGIIAANEAISKQKDAIANADVESVSFEEAKLTLLEQQKEELLKQQELLNKSLATENALKDLAENRLDLIKQFYQNQKDQLEIQKQLKDDVDAINKARRDELKTLEDQMSLEKVAIKYGKDSAEFAKKKAEIDRANYMQQQMSNDLLGNNLQAVMNTYDASVKVSDTLASSEKNAANLASALKESVSAMSSLAGFSDSLDKALAVSVAKVKALKSGANAAIAGTIAGQRLELNSKIDKAVAEGTDRGIVEKMYGGNRQKLSALEASLTTEKALADENKTSGGAVAGKIDTQEEYLAKLSREYAMKKKSLGMTDQQIKRNEFIFTLDEKIATMKTKTSEQDIQTERTKAIASYDSWQAAEKQAAIMTSVTSSLETMFMSFVDGTKSVGDAFKGMLRDIILAIYRQQVAETAARGIGSFISGLVGGLASANGNVFSNGSHVNAYANGGVVGGPTYFPMSGGKTGLMGEAGPEAIMPLKRGANGKLGVQVDGNSGGNITVVQHNSFGAGVSRAEIQAMMPKIVETTKAAVLDAKKRGGSYGSAFA